MRVMGKITKAELKEILEKEDRRDLLWVAYHLRYNWDENELIQDILSFDNKAIEKSLWAVNKWEFEIE